MKSYPGLFLFAVAMVTVGLLMGVWVPRECPECPGLYLTPAEIDARGGTHVCDHDSSNPASNQFTGPEEPYKGGTYGGGKMEQIHRPDADDGILLHVGGELIFSTEAVDDSCQGGFILLECPGRFPFENMITVPQGCQMTLARTKFVYRNIWDPPKSETVIKQNVIDGGNRP